MIERTNIESQPLELIEWCDTSGLVYRLDRVGRAGQEYPALEVDAAHWLDCSLAALVIAQLENRVKAANAKAESEAVEIAPDPVMLTTIEPAPQEKLEHSVSLFLGQVALMNRAFIVTTGLTMAMLVILMVLIVRQS